MVLALAAAAPAQNPASAPAAAASETAHDLIFLAENRPVFVRLRITSGDRPFEASWIDSVRAIFTRASTATATARSRSRRPIRRSSFALVRLARGAGRAAQAAGARRAARRTARSRSTSWPKRCGRSSVRSSFRPSRQAVGRTDALFDQLDRDKDGQLTRSELSAIAGSLRPLDLDDDQMISAYELEPFKDRRSAGMVSDRLARPPGARLNASPPVVELLAG